MKPRVTVYGVILSAITVVELIMCVLWEIVLHVCGCGPKHEEIVVERIPEQGKS